MATRRSSDNAVNERRLIAIGGPTASGKSALALELAERFGGAVINADSMQVYRELKVLTARPGPDAEARAPHLLYGFLSAAERCSAGLWHAAARRAIAEVRAQGRVPILVGGTGLYLRAALDGLADVPAVPDAVKARVKALRAEGGTAAIHARLAALDPAMAERLRPSDTQRLVRALEVIEATGVSLAEFQRRLSSTRLGGELVVQLVVDPPRDALRAACDRRFVAMIADGAIDEVKALLALELDPSLPAMKAVGVRELGAHLSGALSREEAIGRAQAATRQYVKRQQTWFRHQMPAAYRITSLYSAKQFGEIAGLVAEVLGIDRPQAAD
jgi:tRNA dimethylallyltransferase